MRGCLCLADIEDIGYDPQPLNPDWVQPSSCLSPARASSAQVGKMLVDAVVKRGKLGDYIGESHSGEAGGLG